MSKIYDRYEDFNSMNKKELQLAVQTLSKTANQRLRSLEKADMTRSSNAYRAVERFYWDMERFMDKTSKGEIKFKTTTRGRSVNELKEEVGELREFLFKSKTSTVSDVNRRYKQAYETWQKNNPDIKMSQDEFGDMWIQSNMKKLVSMYGSEIAIDIMSGKGYQKLDMKDINEFIGKINEDMPLTELEDILSDMDNTDELDLSDLPF